MITPLPRPLDNGNGQSLSSHWYYPPGEAAERC